MDNGQPKTGLGVTRRESNNSNNSNTTSKSQTQLASSNNRKSVSTNDEISSSSSSNSSGGNGNGNGSHHTLPKNLLMTRGFSKVKANEDILAEARHRIETNLVTIKETSSSSAFSSSSPSQPPPAVHVLNELAYFSFALPNLNRYEDDYRFKGACHLIKKTTTTTQSLSKYIFIKYTYTNIHLRINALAFANPFQPFPTLSNPSQLPYLFFYQNN